MELRKLLMDKVRKWVRYVVRSYSPSLEPPKVVVTFDVTSKRRFWDKKVMMLNIPAFYDKNNDTIYISLATPSDAINFCEVLFHEVAHFLDAHTYGKETYDELVAWDFAKGTWRFEKRCDEFAEDVCNRSMVGGRGMAGLELNALALAVAIEDFLKKLREWSRKYSKEALEEDVEELREYLEKLKGIYERARGIPTIEKEVGRVIKEAEDFIKGFGSLH